MLSKCFLWVLILLTGPVSAQNIFEVRYLGNMGIALIHNDSAIIIDGLHDFYESGYLQSDPNIIKAILQKQKPYKNIVAIAVTHKHNDHFDSKLTTAVANVHTSAVIMGGNQTKELLESTLHWRFVSPGNNTTMIIKPNLTINLKKIAHTYPSRHSGVDNYRVEVVWNGFRLIHFGDAAILPEATRGLSASPDVIVIPQWFLDNDAVPFLEQLDPANIFVTHIAPSTSHSKIKKPAKLRAVTPFILYGDRKIFNLKYTGN